LRRRRSTPQGQPPLPPRCTSDQAGHLQDLLLYDQLLVPVPAHVIAIEQLYSTYAATSRPAGSGNKNFSINFCQRQDREQLGIECAGESQQQLGREYGPELSPGARERKPRQKSRDGKCFRVAEIYTRG